jgi:hypothetical protein
MRRARCRPIAGGPFGCAAETQAPRFPLKWLLITALVFSACSGTSEPSPSTTTPVPFAQASNLATETPAEIPAAAAAVSLPKSYAKLSKRNWAKLVKSPDKYIGKGYQVWGCITQFDAATGPDSFRADASYHKEPYWYVGENSYFNGSEKLLSDFVADDVVVMNVVGVGSYSYDTQAGGNTTAPLFLVVKITRKGSC